MTRKEIIKILEEKKVPINAVFCDSAGGKYVVWGGIEILNAVIGGDVLDWVVENYEMRDYKDWNKTLTLIKNNQHIEAFTYREATREIYMLCDSELKNMIGLVGGFQNYIKTMEE